MGYRDLDEHEKLILFKLICLTILSKVFEIHVCFEEAWLIGS